MSQSPAFRLVTPVDEDAPRRIQRWRSLGLDTAPDPVFDEYARVAAQGVDAPVGAVNLVGTEQHFVGLYPSSQDRGVEPETDSMRSNTCDSGYCLYTVTRKHALALDEVLDYHIFAVNPLVEDMGSRAYLGAPLLDREGEPLGTLCVMDTKPHKWTAEDVAFIKAKAAEVVEVMYRRAGLLDGAG
ncbi:GAF domain-containing protein [Actinomadura sp. B10D3]|uniref:GAF domain-containing protein n=1 Tax=Actinomadura sp. B10D3 TaxID=3153557 RepID=UPI00325D092A